MMDEVLAALESIEQVGSFFAEQQIPAHQLTIKVNKIGALTYPMSQDQIEKLLKIAKPAKFGWKDQTIFDDKVRKVWEVPAKQVRIGKKEWNKNSTD